MKRKALLLGIIGLVLSASAQTMREWQDPQVNEENRLPAHADFVNKNEERLSLHGTWNFRCDDFPTVNTMPKTDKP